MHFPDWYHHNDTAAPPSPGSAAAVSVTGSAVTETAEGLRVWLLDVGGWQPLSPAARSIGQPAAAGQEGR